MILNTIYRYKYAIQAVIVVLITIVPRVLLAQDGIEIGASLCTNASSGDFAPYFIGSLNHGKSTQRNGAYVDAYLIKDLDVDSRWSFGYGVEVVGGLSSANDYMRWNVETSDWDYNNSQGPAPVWLQQAYVEAKYRQAFVMAGLKEHTPSLLNYELSSGDFVESGNARPVPEIRAGFIDFVDVPFTNGWVQMQCQLAYGVMPDNKYVRNHYNYYNYHIAQKTLYNYKFCYFRSNPDARLMVTAGMQSGGFFGGNCEYYTKGVLTETNEYNSNLQSFFNMLLPVFNNGEDFIEGSTLGSWDFYAQYQLNGGDEIAAYFQWPFEDGSGIGRRNQLDGIWGIEYRGFDNALISGIVLEYIDFRDQSGPIHFAPGDYNGPTITTEATGCDNYYNNRYYNAYCNYGMSIGTPFLISPLYNLDGYPAYRCNRANGVHIGINGYLSSLIQYRLLFGYQRGLGTYNNPYYPVRTNTSWLAECRYRLNDYWTLMGRVAMDSGKLRGDNFGALLSVSYRCNMR